MDVGFTRLQGRVPGSNVVDKILENIFSRSQYHLNLKDKYSLQKDCQLCHKITVTYSHVIFCQSYREPRSRGVKDLHMAPEPLAVDPCARP